MELSDDLVKKLVYGNMIIHDQATASVRRWWRCWLMDWDLKRRAEILRCKFSYVPYWMIEATLSGSVDGSVTNCDDAGCWTTPVKKWLRGRVIYTTIASAGGEFDLGYLKGELSGEAPCDRPPISALPVTLSKAGAVAKGVEAIRQFAIKSARVDDVYKHTISVGPGETTLVYYPLWLVHYTYAGKNYCVTVDGNTGEVLAGRAPGNVYLQVVSHVVSFSMILFLAGFLIWLFFLNGYSDSTCLLNMGIGAVAVYLYKKASDYSKYGSEVRQGYHKITYGPLYDKDQADREILFRDLEVKKRPID